jgi:hypothetical protein
MPTKVEAVDTNFDNQEAKASPKHQDVPFEAPKSTNTQC